MIVQSQLIDDRKLVVVAIRGSQWNKPDWTMNFRLAPTAPLGFLDDPGNACHGGFLEAARAMVEPIAAQLWRLIEADPSLVKSSLLFTGHSAGGAVASLLHSHMLARTVDSALTDLASGFKRIHCVTFGTPPLSLLPLQAAKTTENNMFLSFANEGDPIVRADKAYFTFTSLVKLYTAPAPNTRPPLRQRMSRQKMVSGGPSTANATRATKWPVPDAAFSNAGRLVLLREKPADRKNIEAVQLTDDDLRGVVPGAFRGVIPSDRRGVVFGDFAMHGMLLYKKRVDELAFAALSGREAG
ncbi:hypothetical protein LTR08_004149 [Meristemomyces frigidus]|nr:hypothetical protein LTR08_004149 [Meristemomyces frigidus]